MVKKFLLPAFIIVALIQLAIPANMILQRELILRNGSEFRFKTAPIDPVDFMRGKYIYLDFEERHVSVNNSVKWKSGETVYLILKKDMAGFAKIAAAKKNKPKDTAYLKAKVNYPDYDKNLYIIVDFPFDRYYMDEFKAYPAELAYAESRVDTNMVTYALVSIRNGESVLKDVIIDGKPITEFIKQE